MKSGIAEIYIERKWGKNDSNLQWTGNKVKRKLFTWIWQKVALRKSV